MGDIKSDGVNQPVSDKARRWRRKRLTTRLAVLLALLFAGGWLVRVPQIVWARGNVIAEEHAEVRPSVTGVVTGILTHTGAQVAAGDMLVRLDDREEVSLLQEAMRQAQKTAAELARRRAEIAELRRGWGEDIAVAGLRLRNAQSRLERTRELSERGLVAGSALEDDQLQLDLIQAELDSLQARDWRVYDKELAVFEEEAAARREAVARAEAALRARVIRAPVAGRVLRYDFVLGELVRPDMVLLEIFGGEELLLKLRIPERHATRVSVGDSYRARLVSFRGSRRERFEGEILFLRHVIQYDGTSGYRMAYGSFDPRGQFVPPGATAEARIYCGRKRLWFFLLGLD